jgi:ferredoxin
VGENSKTLLAQAEEAGVDLPNSCRAGLCGACMVKVIEGEVKQEQVPAITPQHVAEGYALACCCVPTSDIKAEVNFQRF